MDAFFASVEQLDFPQLRGRPIGITNGLQGTCIITCSYEARQWGVYTGMRVKQAQRICPDFIRRPARPDRYAEVSGQIMESLISISPDVEIFSVDEAFIDVTHCQKLLGNPEAIAHKVKKLIFDVSGLTCTLGLSRDKTSAKFIAKQNKPDGFGVLLPDKVADKLYDVPVESLCGISKGIQRFLASRGARTCGEVSQLPISTLGRRFGNPGRRIWLMCQGRDPEPIQKELSPPKSFSHGKVIPPQTTEKSVVYTYFQHMCQKMGHRLRSNQLAASEFHFGLRLTHGNQWLHNEYISSPPTQNSQQLFQFAKDFLIHNWSGEAVCQIGVTGRNLTPIDHQLDFIEHHNEKNKRLLFTMDAVNKRYGEFVLCPARLLDRSSMPNVISPAWRPTGHRKYL